MTVPQVGISEAKIPPLSEMRPFPILNYAGWIYGQLIPKLAFNEGFKASPANISIGVNEKVIIKIGNYDLETGEYAPVENWFFFADRFIRYDYEVLNGNPGGVWFVNFNPPTVSLKATEMLVSNVTIHLAAPPMADDPIQNTIIRITIKDTWAMNNLWYPDDRSYWPGGDNYKPFAITSPLMWFIGAVTGGFGKLSGKTFTDLYYVDVIVSVKPFHMVKIEALPPSKLTPNEITSIPILVENQGNYNDTFNFRLRTETGYPLTLTDNGTITLKPGEQGQALVGIAVPANILDTGTLHSIFIDAYSAEESNKTIASQRLFIETQGVYFSEQSTVYFLAFGLLLLIVLLFLIRWRRKNAEKTGKRPQKPWTIPVEQQHLTELRRTDKNAFEQERMMMEDEYKSAMQFYKDDRKKIQKRPLETTPKKEPWKKLSDLLKQPVQKPKKGKSKGSLPDLVKKSVKKPKEKTVQPVIPLEGTSKEKAIERILKEQEKQLRRLQ